MRSRAAKKVIQFSMLLIRCLRLKAARSRASVRTETCGLGCSGDFAGMRSDEAGVEPLQSVERAADVGGAVGFQCGEDAPQGLDVVAQEAAAFCPQGVHGGGFGVAELFEGDGDFVEHFECPRAVVDGYGEAFDVEAVE